jgi:hypothetical protein
VCVKDLIIATPKTPLSVPDSYHPNLSPRRCALLCHLMCNAPPSSLRRRLGHPEVSYRGTNELERVYSEENRCIGTPHGHSRNPKADLRSLDGFLDVLLVGKGSHLSPSDTFNREILYIGCTLTARFKLSKVLAFFVVHVTFSSSEADPPQIHLSMG